MSNTVTPAKYQTCICGKECKGISALATHGRSCEVAQTKRAMYLYAIEIKQHMPSDAAIVANYDAIRTALIKKGML